MEKFSRTRSLWLAFLLAIIVLGVFGYLLFTDGEHFKKQEIVDPPIELAEPELPLEIIEVDDSLPAQEEIRENEAEIFVENLAAEPTEAVRLTEGEDQFVRSDSVIALPSLEERVTTLEKLLDDEALADDTPVSVFFTEETREETTIQKMVESKEDHIAPVTIETESGETITAPLSELVKRDDIDKNQPVTEVRQEKKQIQTTVAELAKSDIAPQQEVTVVINHGNKEIALEELLAGEPIEKDSLLYLHRVTEADYQGLWGIIQSGLINKFRRGMRLEGMGPQSTLSVTIPADADEPLPDGLSSFLGKILNQKVTSSYVYNFRTEAMGRNPNLIFPGQQLIMIEFEADEIRDIYLYFAEHRAEEVKTFAISN
ncbi:hypothetical protein Q7C_1670 [Methylophaga frappieri]|uniref:Uncharacterized protein n=1 Tax=Methylophaga frappieri (strain ATCC BAA-2434 / DSM 25690 / JAM7) TaxID=754477 RepID=I1YIS5_METFJ|nr:hypothetical protein [Methylophaga frappieri]AFJ02818.1 hypothetical protein Q7C_1670 [Methylophaga frappieri]